MNTAINKVILMGNLGNEPELRQLGNALLLRLRVATTSRYRDRNDQYQERTDWHTVTLWGKQAEQLAPKLAKGDLLLIEGELRTDSYEKEGIKRWVSEVKAQSVRRMGTRQSQPEPEPSGQQSVPLQMTRNAPSGPPPLPQRRHNAPAHLAA